MKNISIEQLKTAFEAMVKRHSLKNPEEAEQIRNIWTLDDLTQEIAEVRFNGQIFNLGTRSGVGFGIHLGKYNNDIPPDADDRTVGLAVNEVLSYSRFLSLCDLDNDPMPTREDRERNYQAWVNQLMVRHGYNSRRALFKDMKYCLLVRRAGVLTITPFNHYTLEGWDGKGLSKDDHVVVPEDSTPETIGAALRLALSRCTGKKFR